MLNQRADDGVAAQPDGHHQPPIPAEFSLAQASAAANSSGASAKHKGTAAWDCMAFLKSWAAHAAFLLEEVRVLIKKDEADLAVV